MSRSTTIQTEMSDAMVSLLSRQVSVSDLHWLLFAQAERRSLAGCFGINGSSGTKEVIDANG